MLSCLQKDFVERRHSNGWRFAEISFVLRHSGNILPLLPGRDPDSRQAPCVVLGKHPIKYSAVVCTTTFSERKPRLKKIYAKMRKSGVTKHFRHFVDGNGNVSLAQGKMF